MSVRERSTIIIQSPTLHYRLNRCAYAFRSSSFNPAPGREEILNGRKSSIPAAGYGPTVPEKIPERTAAISDAL